jgi:hypothetical protein
METVRKMAMVVNQVRMEDEDHLDVLFWLSREASERLSEVVRLRRNYYTQAGEPFPTKIERVVNQRQL